MQIAQLSPEVARSSLGIPASSSSASGSMDTVLSRWSLEEEDGGRITSDEGSS